MVGFVSKNSKSGIIRDKGLRGGIQTGYGTSLFTGDPVAMTGGFMVRATPGSANVSGIFKGTDYTLSTGRRNTNSYWPASTAATNIIGYLDEVSDDKLFEVVADGAIPQTAIGQYATYVINAGSTLSGQANITLTTASLNAASTSRDVRVAGILNYVREDGVYNDWGAANTRILVSFLRAGDAFVG